MLLTSPRSDDAHVLGDDQSTLAVVATETPLLSRLRLAAEPAFRVVLFQIPVKKAPAGPVTKLSTAESGSSAAKLMASDAPHAGDENSTSASVTIDGDGPYILPQTTGRADLTVYSDGQRTLQLSRNEVQFGQGRGQLQLCTRG